MAPPARTALWEGCGKPRRRLAARSLPTPWLARARFQCMHNAACVNAAARGRSGQELGLQPFGTAVLVGSTGEIGRNDPRPVKSASRNALLSRPPPHPPEGVRRDACAFHALLAFDISLKEAANADNVTGPPRDDNSGPAGLAGALETLVSNALGVPLCAFAAC